MKMSNDKHRKVELEPESLDWDFSYLSKKFEVNIGDYKRWTQLLDPHCDGRNNHDIPFHFERTSTTSSRTLYVRFKRAGNNIRGEQMCRQTRNENDSMDECYCCFCIPAFDALKVWIPQNDTSCWFDLEIFAKILRLRN